MLTTKGDNADFLGWMGEELSPEDLMTVIGGKKNEMATSSNESSLPPSEGSLSTGVISVGFSGAQGEGINQELDYDPNFFNQTLGQ